MFWLLAPVLVALVGLGVWSNHFESSFHADDIHNIVNNRAVHSLSVSEFFTTPRISSDQREYSDYRPWLTTTFAFDYSLAKGPVAQAFQIDTFGWFLLQLVAVYLLFIAVPGSDHRTALLAAAVLGLHPLTAETVNYISRRGNIIAALGVLTGLAFWIVWPRRLPARIIYFDAVPKNGWDEFRRVWSPRINKWYRTFIQLPLFFYLIPVVFGLLAESAAAAFALILLVYMLLFDRSRVERRIIPAGVVCLGYWVAHLAITWRFGAGVRQPFFGYLNTQPLVICRYFLTFFIPVHLSPIGNLRSLAHFWSPLALVGYAGLAGLVWAAVQTARRPQWRTVSFGIWWFLAALAPSTLIPQPSVESDERMYLAMIGLAFAAASSWRIVFDHFLELAAADRSRRIFVQSAAGASILVLLTGCAWATYGRNRVWTSEITLWEDATHNSPMNPVGYIRYADALVAVGATDDAYANLEKAASLTPDDAAGELALARSFDALSKNKEAEEHFKRAIALGAGYSAAYSYYAQWLLIHQRPTEALTFAKRAAEMNPWDMEARHVLLDFYSAENNWPDVRRVAEDALKFDPTDAGAQHARDLARSVYEKVAADADEAEHAKTADGYLKLSVGYYQTRQFEKSIEACRQALRVHPDLAEAYSNIAAANFALGRLDDTIAALQEALRIRPDFQLAQKNLAFVLRLKSQKAETPGTPLSPPSPR